jgi:hypothetical protein
MLGGRVEKTWRRLDERRRGWEKRPLASLYLEHVFLGRLPQLGWTGGSGCRGSSRSRQRARKWGWPSLTRFGGEDGCTVYRGEEKVTDF